MKKFTKMSAVLAALVLVLSCFAGCKNNDDDSSSSSALDGLWFESGEDEGLYIQGDKAWIAMEINGSYYYMDKMGNEDYTASLKIDGNNYTLTFPAVAEEAPESGTFTIDGDTLTTTSNGESVTYGKVNTKPTAVSTLSDDKIAELFGGDE